MFADRWIHFLVAASVGAATLVACTSPWVNLSKLGVSTWPDTPNQVLAGDDPVRVTFSDPVDHPSTQSLLNVTSAEGSASGDMSWQGNTLVWTPVPPLTPGKRYSLEFSGQVKGADGRVFTQAVVVPFYSVSAALPGVLGSYSPADGASISVTQPLVLSFPVAMDPAAFETGFSVAPTVAVAKSWSADATTVTITPTSAWTSATLYSWHLSTVVKTSQDLPLVAPVDHTFLTNLDQVPPRVVSVVPGVWVAATSSWAAAGNSLNDLRTGDDLLVTTNKPVTMATLGTAFRLIPALKGHFVAQSVAVAPYQYVYQLDEALGSGATYSLQIGTDLRDTVGNTLTTEWLTSFTPAIPYLQVTAIELTGTATAAYDFSNLNRSNFFPACAPSGVVGSLQIAVKIGFSRSFSATEKVQFAVFSLCQPLFPTTGTSAPPIPTLVTVDASLGNSVVLTYRGFSVNGTPGAPFYYQVKVPGGASGVTAAGHSLKEDVWINFTTGL